MKGIGLSHSEMEIVGEVFRGAEEATAACFLGEDDAQRIADFRYYLAVSFIPHTSVSANGLAAVRSMVFGHSTIMNFVLTLHSKFMMRWAKDEETVVRLHANLARGCCIEPNATIGGYNAEMVLAPKEITSRISSGEDAFSLLNHNPWIAVLILSSLYPSLEVLVPGKGQRKKAAQADNSTVS